MLFWLSPSTTLFWVNNNPPVLFWGDWASCVYDDLGRLSQVSFKNGQSYAINYDAAGNRTSVVQT
jgi:YD repeat-containing protein